VQIDCHYGERSDLMPICFALRTKQDVQHVGSKNVCVSA
jgi:hypothetical protein